MVVDLFFSFVSPLRLRHILPRMRLEFVGAREGLEDRMLRTFALLDLLPLLLPLRIVVPVDGEQNIRFEVVVEVLQHSA